jgi:diacylglycerol kinase family enzyme
MMGKFNVTIFTHKNKKDLIEASTMMMRGKYPHNDKELISFETDCVDITNLGDEQLTFFGDGEVLEKGKSFNVSIIPSSLNVCSYDETLLYCHSYSLENVELM